MKNKRGLAFITTGMVMIFMSACLAGYNLYEGWRSAQASAQVTQQMNIEPVEEVPLYITHPEIEMPVENINGNDYIGIVAIDALGLELPVISQWSYPALKIAPCRYTGSVYMGDMIIAAHDYRTGFGKLKTLSGGEIVTFTDMDGNVFEYYVDSKEVLEPSAVEDLLAGEWNLTLFTCTPDAANRLAVRCKLTEQ